jgi:aconitate hydratase
VQKNPADILHEVQKEGQKLFAHSGLTFDLMSKIKDNRVVVEQGIIGSCAGGSFENINAAADILAGKSIGSDFFNMSVYPFSNPVYLELMKNGSLQKLIEAGAIIKPAICGPCFGAGDIPANGELSVRSALRNFPNREGSMANDRQLCSVALMDSRSVAATALRGGVLTAATELDVEYRGHRYHFDGGLYNRRAYNGQGKPRPEVELQMGPDIKDWPAFYPMEKAVLLKLVSVFPDPVITTDDLIPSYASSYRSDPERMSEYVLAMRDPNFVPASKAVRRLEEKRRDGVVGEELAPLLEQIRAIEGCQVLDWKHISIGSALCGNKVGDGSAREQAASCQRVQGALANLAAEFATKRYVSNLKNWGVLPLLLPQNPGLSEGDHVFLPYIRSELAGGAEKITAYWISGRNVLPLSVDLAGSNKSEREILLKGGLINYYRV